MNLGLAVLAAGVDAVVLHPAPALVGAPAGCWAFSVAGLLVIMAVMVLLSPIYGIYAWTGYFFVYRLRLGWPRLVGAFVVRRHRGDLAGRRPAAHRRGRAASTRFCCCSTWLIAVGFTWFGSLSNEQNERRKQLVAELSEANRKLEATLAENAGLHEQLLAQAREAGISDERQRMAREIHDTLAQGLTGIVTQLQAAEQAGARRRTAAGT